ncbi:MAG: sensor histidine kinase [Sphingomonadaceae bacterium]|nr:sensor histidine kinase [Sphingomonadaceae bacterium]
MPRCVVPAQGGLVWRAVRNLVDNAVKYGGSARIAVSETGDRAELRVADNGPGIPQSELERALEPFSLLEASRNRDTGGTGLGLAIARSIAESHGGSLTLGPNAPRGLAATISLPRGDRTANPATAR